jgi:hypothetical protein
MAVRSTNFLSQFLSSSSCVLLLVDVSNTGSFLPLLTSWGSPRGLKGWLSAGDSLRGADFHLVAGPSSWECSREPQRLFETSGLSNYRQIRYFCLAWPPAQGEQGVQRE